ncbi:hypothetical protein RJT34_18173 [Clitoria ternatea]|uniref:Uncharacterized protein n=1 Tax=Clitoria ternatea TaxID=43366 RepID=A0AAN9JAU9_CLITE
MVLNGERGIDEYDMFAVLIKICHAENWCRLFMKMDMEKKQALVQRTIDLLENLKESWGAVDGTMQPWV